MKGHSDPRLHSPNHMALPSPCLLGKVALSISFWGTAIFTLCCHLLPITDLSVGGQVVLSLQPQMGFILEPGEEGWGTHPWGQVLLRSLRPLGRLSWRHSHPPGLAEWQEG